MSKKVVTTFRMESSVKKGMQKLAQKLGISFSRLMNAMIDAAVRGDIFIEGMEVKVRRPFLIQGKNGKLVFHPTHTHHRMLRKRT